MKIKMENELYHFGIKGMKWGIRRYQNKDGSLTAAGKKRYSDSSIDNEIKNLTDQELRDRINRLNLEKQYRDLTTPSGQKQVNKGKQFVTSVLETSGKNIATQLVTYGMGTAVNKFFKANIVNPKKGQKDK